MRITGFLAMDGNGIAIQADPYGNNIAVACSVCGHPLLLTAVKKLRGSDENHPAECRGCGQQYFLDVREHKEMLYVIAL